jgi:hypothetical protein
VVKVIILLLVHHKEIMVDKVRQLLNILVLEEAVQEQSGLMLLQVLEVMEVQV